MTVKTSAKIGVYTKYLEWQLKRKRSRFKVLDGNKKKDDDKPTYH